MRTILALLMLTPAAKAAAFDLPAMRAGGLPVTEAAALPAPAGADACDWDLLRAGFFRAAPPADLYSIMGEYRGYLHPLYEREDYTVPFRMVVYRDPASGEVKAVFPMYDTPETVTLKMTKYGAEFADAWGGRARLVIRVLDGRLYLFSNLYSDETYGAAEPVKTGRAPAR